MRSFRVVAMVVALAASGAAGVCARPIALQRPRAFAAMLVAPSAGDVSYGVAQVRIVGRSRVRPAPASAGQVAYAGRVGGLAVTVRSPAWGVLRATTRVYLVVSRVAGGDSALRDLALFIVRRHGKGRARRRARAVFDFSLANAVPAAPSFWVRGLDRDGLAHIFAVRDLLATAVANWGRYLGVLRAEDALTAAARPLELAHPVGQGRAAAPGTMSVWLGGQRATPRVRAVFHVLLDALGNPLQYAAAKQSPVIADFIGRELNNPGLARRWRVVAARLPLRVPDRYAAAAQEEALFAHVHSPRITRAVVAMDDATNSSSQMILEDPANYSALDIVQNGSGNGTVRGSEYVYGPNIDCGSQCRATFVAGATSETLSAAPAKDSAFAGWSGCDQILPSGACWLEAGRANRTVTATFNLANSIQVIVVGPGRDDVSISSDPPNLQCDPSQCVGVFSPGQDVTLSEHGGPSAKFVSWTGCDDTGYDDIHLFFTCDVHVRFSGRQVIATVGLGNATGPVITRLAGAGSPCQTPPACGDGGPATGARLAFPSGVAVDDAGNLYIADTFDQEVRMVASDGTITRIAGTGSPCSTPTCGDGGPATSAQLSNPSGVALDPKGNLYIADTGDNEVRKLAPDGTITRFAGDGNYCASPPDCGDGNPATIAQLTQPSTVATDVGGDVYIADKGDNEIRRVTPDGRITRLAGTGRACTMTPACGDGGPAINSRLSSPSGVVIDGSYVYVADTADSEVRRFHAGGDIELVAGDGTRCTTAPACGDDGPATSAELSSPSGLATDESGTELYIADTGDHEVRKLALHTNTITRVAGDGIRCVQPPACGDGGDPTSATISFPGAVAFDSAGNLYIGDTQDQEIRRVG